MDLVSKVPFAMEEAGSTSRQYIKMVAARIAWHEQELLRNIMLYELQHSAYNGEHATRRSSVL